MLECRISLVSMNRLVNSKQEESNASVSEAAKLLIGTTISETDPAVRIMRGYRV